jgi:hypothetical protein
MNTVTKKKKVHYINNKTFYEEMVKYKSAVAEAEKNEKQKPKIPNYIGECFMMICKKLSSKPNFINYSYKEDMIADAIENCVMSVDNFNPERSTNPFAYFTQIAWNAFIRRISKEKKQSYIKHKNFENNFMLEELEYSSAGSKSKVNEISSEIIKSFEEKLTLTKNEKKSKVVTGVEKFISES